METVPDSISAGTWSSQREIAAVTWQLNQSEAVDHRPLRFDLQMR